MELKEYQQIVYNAARAAGLNDVQAKIITAQAQHESGNFKSNVFKTDNNLFGMKMPSKRSKQFIERPSKIVMRAEGATPYAHYSSIQNSVKDLILGWHAYNKTNWDKIKTPADYATYLKAKGYYGAPYNEYLRALTIFLSKLDWVKVTAVSTTGLAIVALLIVFITYK